MNKSHYLIFMLLLAGSLLFAGDYYIGDGSSTQSYVPMYGYANFGWSKFFYSSTEMQDAGYTSTQEITRISFQLDGNELDGYVTDNQTVYMGHFYNSSATSSYQSPDSYTLVYSGTIVWNGPGWVELILDTPFTYNPQWGIEILWENRDGSRISSPPKFCYTNTSVNTCAYKYGTSFSTSAGTTYKKRPNIWFATATTEAPNPAAVVSPLNTAGDLELSTSLRWNHTGGSPTGYRLWLGTDNPPSNIASAVLLDTNSYTPENYLDYGTTYYWRVVPFNANGPAMDCPLWSFTTLNDPSITDFPYAENFDGDTFPPAHWINIKGNLSDPIIFSTPGSTNWNQGNWLNTDTGDKAAKFNLWGPLEGYLISPLFNIPSDDYVIEFDIALLKANQTPSGNPPALNGVDDRFAILVGDGFTWSTANVIKEWNNSSSDYVLNEIAITSHRIRIPLQEHNGRIRIAIYAGSTESNADNDFMINNFWVGIPSAGLSTPQIALQQSTVNGQALLTWDAVPGATLYRIYKANDPYGVYLPVATSSGTSYTLDTADNKAFFEIKAEY